MTKGKQTNKVTRGMLRTILLVGALTAGLLGGAGCDEMGYGLDYGYLDYGVVQDVLDYRSSVFDSANDAWSDYIRM